MNFWKFCIKYEKIQFFFRKFHILWPITQKSTLRSQNDKNVILLITFYAFLGIFKAFLKILHKIWKNLIFLLLISYFMTYHSKIHIKVSKFNNKRSRPNFRPFWTPVNFLKLMKPDLYNFFESNFWTPWWCSFLVYMPFSWRNSFVNKWYLVGVIPVQLVL